MSVIDDYLAGLDDPEKAIIEHMYSLVREWVPEVAEELSYAMPAFKYRDKGLVAIMVNKDFMSLYPFGSIEKLGIDLSAYERTTGSVHFTVDRPIVDELFRQIIQARRQQIER